MAAVARGIGGRGNAVQLSGVLGKTSYFYNLFSQSAALPVYLFVSLLVVTENMYLGLNLFRCNLFIRSVVKVLVFR